MTGPYAASAWAYRRAGWAGVLPLPPGAKWPPPGGYTGWAGIEPSGADIQAWADGPQGAGNVALRMPAGVYGLDVDDYGSKSGGTALGELVERLGPLPATWVASSREESTSGIRLFRADLPVGRRWRDEPAGHSAGIEAIHLGHRYAVAWPSLHPDTGRKYRWRRPDGLLVDDEVPRPRDLPHLPAVWIEALTEPGEVRVGAVAGHAETIETVTAWRDGEPCPRVADAHARALHGLAAAADGAALHPVSLAGVHELTNLGHEGHAGVRRALAEHYAAHVEARRARGETAAVAEGEWWRAVRGAIGKLPGGALERCDCDLWSGEGLLFDPSDLFDSPAPVEGGEAPAATDVEARPAGPAADVPLELVPEVVDELRRLRVREYATEIHRAQVHARHWAPPASYGTLAQELLLPDDEPQWRVHGLLGLGHNAILVAGRKAGKTTMVNEFVRSYVDGGMFLGAQPVTPAPGGIAIFNYEVDERQYRRWLRDVGIHNAEQVHVLHLRGRSLALMDARVRAWVAAWLRDRGVSAWVLDPYSRAYVGSVDNGNDEAKVSAFLDTLDVIKADAGISELIMPVHTPKGRAEEGNETAIGSQRLEAWPDVMWYLTRDGKTRFLRAEGRDVEFDESELHFDESTRRLKVELFGQDRKTSRQTAKLDRLIAFIHANPECTTNQIRDELGINATTVGELVAASAGRIAVEQGPNRAKIHILKSDITGGTKSSVPPSPTESHRAKASGTSAGIGRSPTPLSHSASPAEGAVPLNPFDLEDVTP